MAPGSSFIGRTNELRSLDEFEKSEARSLAVVGLVGMGKSRLCAEWARRTSLSVAIADVEDCTDGASVLRALADAAGVRSDRDISGSLEHLIEVTRDYVLVLDHAERLPLETSRLLQKWLQRHEHFRLILCARHELPWTEGTLRLPPLSAPVEGAEGTAYELFVERTRYLNPSFEPSPREAATIRSIVATLGGCPHVLELAASRLRVMNLERLKKLICDDDRMVDILDSDGSNIRRALEDTWSLLKPAERSLLAQLSMFDGLFHVDAVEAIIGVPEGEATLSSWVSLSEQFLVVPKDAVSFSSNLSRLPAPVRSFARTKLHDDERNALKLRYTEWLVSRSESAADTGVCPHWTISELRHLESAVHAEASVELRRRTIFALDSALVLRGAHRYRKSVLGDERIEEAFETDAARCELLLRRADAEWRVGDASTALEQLDEIEATGGDQIRCRAANLRCDVLDSGGERASAEALMRENVLKARSHGYAREEARAQHNLGRGHLFALELTQLIPCARAAKKLFAVVDDAAGVNLANRLLSCSYILAGRVEEAMLLCKEGIADAEERGDRDAYAYNIINLTCCESHLMLDAAATFSVGREEVLRFGHPYAVAVFLVLEAARSVDVGAFSTAKEIYSELETNERFKELESVSLYCKAGRAAMAMQQGDMAGARSLMLLPKDPASLAASTEASRQYRLCAALSCLDVDPGRGLSFLEGIQQPDPLDPFGAIGDCVRTLLTTLRSLESPAAGIAVQVADTAQEVEELDKELVPRSLEARLVVTVAHRILDERMIICPANHKAPALVVGHLGEWFATGDEYVNLQRRVAVRNILRALVEARIDGRGVSREELIRRGWPGEATVADSARARLHVAVSTLRKLGLQDLLQLEAGAYHLCQDTTVVVSKT